MTRPSTTPRWRTCRRWQVARGVPVSGPDRALPPRSGRPVFNLDALREIVPVAPIEVPATTRPRTASAIADGEEPAGVEGAGGEHRYVIGADVAEGLDTATTATAHVIDVKTMEVVALPRAHRLQLFGTDVLFNLGKWYNQALIGVENNNHGLCHRQGPGRYLLQPDLQDPPAQPSPGRQRRPERSGLEDDDIIEARRRRSAITLAICRSRK